jgi:hypothetical protein
MTKPEIQYPRKFAQRWQAMAAAAIMTAFIVITVLSCAKVDNAFLMGLWVTSTEPYQKSTIEISTDRITFNDPLLSVPDICMMKKISIKKGKDTSLIKIEYMNSAGAEFRRQIIYSSWNGGSFWFRNQPAVVWVRAKNSAGAVSMNNRQAPGLLDCLREGFIS